MDKRNRRWQNIFILPKHQVKYLLLVGGSGAGLILFNVLTYFTFVQKNYSVVLNQTTMDFLNKQQFYADLNKSALMLGSLSVLYLALVCWFSLLISHRAAGPIYRFNTVFKEIRDGNLAARIKLRPGDDFQDVAESFNQMMDAVASNKKS